MSFNTHCIMYNVYSTVYTACNFQWNGLKYLIKKSTVLILYIHWIWSHSNKFSAFFFKWKNAVFLEKKIGKRDFSTLIDANWKLSMGGKKEWMPVRKKMQINKIDWNSFGAHKLHQIQLSHEKFEADVHLSSLKSE